MKERLEERFRSAIRAVLDAAGEPGEPPEFTLVASRNPAHGDFACNAALLLGKRLGRSPRPLAEAIRERLVAESGVVERAEVAGPGFVNVWLADSRWQELLRRVLAEGPAFGRSTVGGGRRVQVEFVSANPTGPLTLGHGRQAVLGDSLVRLLEAAGFAVTREYYFNNGGRQMRMLGDSVRARYLEQIGRAAPPPADALADENLPWPASIGGLPVVFPRDGYQGEYIAVLAADLRREHGDDLADGTDPEIFRRTAESRIFAGIRRTLDALHIAFDVYSNEMSLYEEGHVEAALRDLRVQGLVYDEEGAVWLRATKLGQGRDRVLVKRTGEATYLLPDIAYHREKFRRGFELVIDVQGADHIEQFPFVRAAAAALGCPADRIELLMNQFVTLNRGGVQVKQSTRRATYVTVDELLEEVGVDVFRFFMVQRKAEGHLDFDLELAKETDWKKNPAYYVQYGHARTWGIERNARAQGLLAPDAANVDPAPLRLPEEIDLLKKLGEFEPVVLRAAETREPHHVAYYLRELAGLWNPYVQDRVHHRVVSEDVALTNARLGLTRAVRTVLANGLALLGISAPEQM